MSVAGDKEFAEAADLLQGAEAEKEVEIVSLGKKVKIKKILCGEVADVLKVARDNEVEQWIWLVFKGLVEPKLTIEQVRKLPTTILAEIAAEISTFSGLDRESVNKIENLLKTKSSRQCSK